jgi:hypothetical protein
MQEVTAVLSLLRQASIYCYRSLMTRAVASSNSTNSKLLHTDSVCACAFTNSITQQTSTRTNSSSTSSNTSTSGSQDEASEMSKDEKKWLKAAKDPKLKLAVTEWEAVHLSDRPDYGVQVRNITHAVCYSYCMLHCMYTHCSLLH